ncbi:DUF4279 domain-containing protein [Ornithinibacillus halotolerans]|uniref:Uncharacterized protein n=1 Tax=Ornithinibacillus halotolerans TaxID=1274357 RepID=A0A916RL80_9BACI|nr:DUF4279 domain-containing protein [Ornithinibacillus halotolerans]GGA60681.1 hypothetical protein GCM10008025_00900 [Ornithinibacillus halotolerans]
MQTTKGTMEALGLSIPFTLNQKNNDNEKLVIVLPDKEYSTQAPVLFYARRVFWEDNFDVLDFRYAFQELDEDILPVAVNEMIISFLQEHHYTTIHFVSMGLGSKVAAYFLKHQVYPGVHAVWFSPHITDEKVLQVLLNRQNKGLIFFGDDGELVLEEVQVLEEKEHLTVGYASGNDYLDSYWVETSLDVLQSIMKTMQQFIKHGKVELIEDKSEIKVYLTLYGDDFPLEEVTEKLGIEPTRTCKKGDEMVPPHGTYKPAIKRYYPDTSWELDSGYIESTDVEVEFDKLVDKLRSKIFIINELREKYNLKSYIQVVPQLYNGDTPILTVNKKLINFAYRIQAEFIDYDMYIYPFDNTVRFERDGFYFKGRKL